MILLETLKNFWVLHEDYLSIEIFKDLYTKDKSKNKEESSKYIWAILLYMHPKSLYFNMSHKDKIEYISKNYHKIDIKKAKEFVSIFDKVLLTPAKRSLIQWNKTMEERDEFMASLNYDEDTWEIKDKMMIATPKLYAEYERIKEALEKDGEEAVNQGGGELSASEKGII